MPVPRARLAFMSRHPAGKPPGAGPAAISLRRLSFRVDFRLGLSRKALELIFKLAATGSMF